MPLIRLIRRGRKMNICGVLSFSISIIATFIFIGVCTAAYIRSCNISTCGWMNSGVLFSGRLVLLAALIALVGLAIDEKRIIAACGLTVAAGWLMIFARVVYRF